MLFKGSLLTQASGSLGGITASHNRGGAYLRARTIPTNPNAPRQQDVRKFFSDIQVDWKRLTAAQVAAWRAYALSTPTVNALGAPIVLQANAMCARLGVPRLQAELSWSQGDAPSTPGLADFTAPTNIVASSTAITFTMTAADAWRSDPGAALLVYASFPVSDGVLFFKGPYKYIGRVLGALIPPSTAGNIQIPPDLAPNVFGKRFVRIFVTDAEQRLSTVFERPAAPI